MLNKQILANLMSIKRHIEQSIVDVFLGYQLLGPVEVLKSTKIFLGILRIRNCFAAFLKYFVSSINKLLY